MGKIESWIKEFSSESTRTSYRSRLNTFQKCIGEDLERYVEDTTDEEFERDFKEYVNWLVDEKEYAPKTVASSVAVVKQFIKEMTKTDFDESVWKRLKRRKLKKVVPITQDKAGSRKEWRRILKNMDLKGRSLFMFLLSSGCRIGEALNLEKKDTELDEMPPEATIRNENTKTGESRKVFFSTEARDEIEEWLEYRKNLKRKDRGLTEEEKEELSEEEQKQKKKELTQKRKAYQNSSRVWPISKSTVSMILTGALKKAGLEERDRRTERSKIHTHSTRKYFRTNCQLSKDVRNYLLGHSSELDKSYLRLEESGIDPAEEYLDNMRNLMFFEPEAALTEQMKKEQRETRLEDLKLIAEAVGVPDTKIEAMQDKAVKLQKLRDAGFDADEALPKDVGVVNEYYQRAEEQHDFSQIEVDFPVDVDEDIFNWWKDAIRKLVTKESQGKDETEQKVVKEEKVEEYLNEGWKFVNKLNENECVVEKRG